MVCLIESNPEVREQIQNLADKLGTEYDIAKIILQENNGYDLDKAPNGAQSKLYKDLLEAFNGDEQQALIAKAKTYLQPFFNWFGEWTADDKTNVSKVVDENGEPLVVYHGGAQDIQIFKTSSEQSSNTGYGTYTDKKTGETIPVDSNRTMFFSSNKYVARSYAHLHGIQYYSSLLYKVNDIIQNSVFNGDNPRISFSKQVFQNGASDVYELFTKLSEVNPRFQKLREYAETINKQGKTLNARDVSQVRQMLIDARDNLEKFSDQYLMNRSQWEDSINTGRQIIDQYNNSQKIKDLQRGEIPEPILKEWEIYKNIIQDRDRLALPKISNYDTLSVWLYNGYEASYMEYDGEFLYLRDDNVEKYKKRKVIDMSEDEIKQYFDTMYEKSSHSLQKLKQDASRIDSKSQSYGVFLNIKNPFIHDYRGTHQGQGYRQNERIPFGYVAARQVDKAIKENYDGVVYQNLYDPYLADNYGVFNSNQIKNVYNSGSYSTTNPNQYYKKSDTTYHKEAEGRLETIGEFTNTQELIDYILTLDNVDERLKNLLKTLRQESTSLLIDEYLPEDRVAEYFGYVRLYAPRINEVSNQEFAEDVAHEIMHHYLQLYYDTNPEFRSKLDDIQSRYKQSSDNKDYYGFTGDSAEFLMEFMTNRAFRLHLKIRSNNIFNDVIKAIIAVLKKLFTGKKTKVSFNKELQELEDTIYDLLSRVNKGDIQHYTIESYNNVSKRYRASSNPSISNRSIKLYDKIRKGLNNRLKAIKHYSTKNIKAENQLQTLMQDLSNLDAIEGTLEFIDHVSQSIQDCIRFLNTPYSNINYKQIRQLSDDYIGFYKPLIDEVFSAFVNTDDFKNIPDYDQILESVRTIQSDMSMIDIKFNELLKNKGKQLLVDHLNSTNTPQEFIDRILNWLDDPTNDGNFLTTWLGMSSESTNEVITTIANILNSVMNETQRKTYQKGIELVKILDKAKKKYGNDVQKILYELDNNGKYTGFMVRKLNYGQMRQDYIDYTEKLAKKLGIQKDNEGKFIMPEDLTVLDKWLTGINKFYSDHAERRFTPQYYELRNRMLSHETRQALDEINTAINEILDYVYEDGVYYENLLTPQMFNKLQQLRRNKKLLSIEYNLDGTMKTGLQLQIAREIQAFNKAIYGDNPESKVNYKKFKEDEAKVIARYGKDSDEHKYWIARNTTTRLTQEFYDRMDNLQSNKNQQSQTYKELVDKRSQLLKIYRQNGIVNVDELSESDKQMLLQLDQDIADAYVLLDSQYDENQDKFNDFATINTTEQYDRDYRAASINQATFDQWFNDNHYEDAKGNMRPASYYTYLWAKEARYVETVPTGRYSQLEALPQYTNNNFDINGPAIQPKKSLYDNSKQYNKIMQSKELRDLYNAVLDTMREANKLISYFTSTDTYKMPQIEARMLQVLSRSNGLFDAIGYASNDIITTKADDTDYVDEFLVKPNGQPLKLIPTRYIKMLSNTNNISTDAIGSVIQYYSMALNYSGMSEQQDKIEILLKLLYESTMTTKKGYKGKGSMNYYQQAQALVDRIMYGRKVDPIKANIGGKEINISKALNNIRNWVSKVNLSFNFNTIGVSFLTDATYTTLEAKLGRFFNSKDFSYAKKRFLQELPEILANTGNPVPTTVVGYLMQLNQVVRDNQEIFSRLDQSAALRAINQHFWYLGYTQTDYTVKSHSLISIYHSYKLIKNNGFMSRDQFINKFYPNDRKKGEVEFDHLDSITLIDAYEKYKDGFRVKPQYQEFVTQSLQDQVKNRIEIVTKRIDGTLRDIDKAKIHANSVTAYLTQHRNFMINGLHQRFKGRTYNQDMQVIENGYYPTTYRFLSNVIGNKHYAVKQILEDYNNLDESEQYAIRRVLYDLALVASTTIVALTVMHIVDSDDDYSNWFTEEIAYLALRSAFEFRSMYNPVELMSLIKSPTAAFSYFENQYNILGILNPLNYIYGKTPWTAIDRGVYEGWPRILKTIIKTTPFKNILEIQDPKAKRNYLKNQLMSF